jgi:hypothetical protein
MTQTKQNMSLKPNSTTRYTVYFLLLFIGLFGCLKKFDQPETYTGINIHATLSIRALSELHISGNAEKLTDDWIITGIVTANDATDNFYKTIVIQDSTAAITIRMDGFGLSADFPLGKRIFVRLNGLWLGEYGGMLQLGGAVDRTDPAYPELLPIPTPLFAKCFIHGSKEKIPEPLLVHFDELKNTMQSRLITIDSVELVPGDTAKPFADIVNKATVNHTLRICNGGSLYLRTSGFASFAAVKTPRGNGKITGIYSTFGSQKQIIIRDTSDIKMNGGRCSGNSSRQLFYQDFESIAVGADFALTGWKNLAEAGGQLFSSQMAAANRYVSISAFASKQSLVTSWLILPPINLNSTASEQLSFLTKDAFDNGATLQVYISTNYDGGLFPWKAKWSLLKSLVAKGAVSNIASKWTASGNISLNSFSGLAYIAFKYEGNDLPDITNKKTTAFQIDEIKVMGN